MPLSFKEQLTKGRIPLPAESLLLQRSGFLGPADRELVKSLIGQGLPAAQLARLTGQPGYLLRRRVRRILGRLQSPQFLSAARALPYLSGPQARLARMCFCQGFSLRQAAEALELTYFQARAQLMQIKAVIARLEQESSPAPDPRRWTEDPDRLRRRSY